MTPGKETSEHAKTNAATWKGWVFAALSSVIVFLQKMPDGYDWVPVAVLVLTGLAAAFNEQKLSSAYAISRGMAKQPQNTANSVFVGDMVNGEDDDAPVDPSRAQ